MYSGSENQPSSNATHKTLFDSTELAELINHTPDEFMAMDTAEVTHQYDCEFIEEVLRKVMPLADVDRVIGFINVRWMIDVDDRRPLVAHYDVASRQWVAYIPDLPERLAEIRSRIARRLELEARQHKLMEEWHQSHASSATPTQALCQAASVENVTEQPFYKESEEGKDKQPAYHMSDLPDDVSKYLLLKDDATYTCFVEDLCGPVKEWVDKHNLQDWNVVKFTGIVHGLFARNTPTRACASLIEAVVPDAGNQFENMKKRTDASKKNLGCYLNNPKFWKLKNDVKAVGDCLANTIEKMSD